MFDLFTRRKAANLPAQIVNQGSVEIRATREAAFERLHPLSPKFGLIADGFSISRRPNGEAEATHPDMPETVLRIERITSTPPQALAFRARFEGAAQIGGAIRFDSVYKLESIGDLLCCVHLTETATLKPGLGKSARKREAKLLAEALETHLAKLKESVERDAG